MSRGILAAVILFGYCALHPLPKGEIEDAKTAEELVRILAARQYELAPCADKWMLAREVERIGTVARRLVAEMEERYFHGQRANESVQD